MKLAIIAAIASLGLAPDAAAQDAPRVTAVQALANGVREVCVPAYGLSAMMRTSGATPSAVREIFTQIEGWPIVEPIPEGIVPAFDEAAERIFLGATLEQGEAGRVVAVVELSTSSPTCDLVAFDTPNAAAQTIAAFTSEFTPVGTPSVSRDAGIDLFGLRMSDRGPDFGVTVYSPLTPRAREMGLGAVVSVTLIPRDAIDTGVFNPARP